ncbi:hypothetical protein SS50377_20693 [Spironucleus salmonicida]|uniref:Uncharacterized protein n=1 Tax=Spironucleus salmonicida TaxID=348837 RepID=V6LY15_9EUKA|nr:hypothetical protein SS50377_20693 [Spironucleus salmonicida]|eukprot:EST49542.1 Hypothetical protein SS50377_10146 [Spironucleus salmonicida]
MSNLSAQQLQSQLTQSQLALNHATENYNQIKTHILMQAKGQIKGSQNGQNANFSQERDNNRLLSQHIIDLQLKYQRKKGENQQLAEIVSRLNDTLAVAEEDLQVCRAKLSLHDELVVENQSLKRQISDLRLQFRTQNNPKIIAQLDTEVTGLKGYIVKLQGKYEGLLHDLRSQGQGSAADQIKMQDLERLRQQYEMAEQRCELERNQRMQLKEEYDQVVERNYELEQQKFKL